MRVMRARATRGGQESKLGRHLAFVFHEPCLEPRHVRVQSKKVRHERRARVMQTTYEDPPTILGGEWLLCRHISRACLLAHRTAGDNQAWDDPPQPHRTSGSFFLSPLAAPQNVGAPVPLYSPSASETAG